MQPSITIPSLASKFILEQSKTYIVIYIGFFLFKFIANRPIYLFYFYVEIKRVKPKNKDPPSAPDLEIYLNYAVSDVSVNNSFA